MFRKIKMANIYFNGALKLNVISSEINKLVKIILQVKVQQYSQQKKKGRKSSSFYFERKVKVHHISKLFFITNKLIHSHPQESGADLDIKNQ